MKTLITLLSFGTLSFLLTVVFIPLLKRIAIQINLVDKPNYRKIHTNTVPLIGGLAIASAAIIVVFVSGNLLPILQEYATILTAGFILLIVGAIDDKNDISAKYKLVIQMLLALIIALSENRITSLYGLFGVYDIAVWVQYVLTIVVITGVVNAFNLMDGVDGLVGGLSVLGFCLFLLTAIYFNDYFLGFLSVIFIGATIGFLKYNLSSKKIFMGDSGSLFLGFILVTIGIHFMKKQTITHNYEYAYGFLLLITFFSIPVLDSIRVYLGRIKEGDSPFKADKSHLHHLLLRIGLTHKKVALTVITFCLLLFFIGFGLVTYFSTTLIILVTFLVFWTIIKILFMIANLQEWKGTLKKLEQR